MTGELVRFSDHPDKDVRKWLKPLAEAGWTFHKEGHGLTARCPCDAKCTSIRVGSTPNTRHLKRRIETMFKRCPMDPDDARRNLTGTDR